MSNSPATRTPAQAPEPQHWFPLGILLTAFAMLLVGVTISHIATPSITAGLKASPAALSWALSGYLLAYALSLVPAGRLGDKYGHKAIFIGGVALYVATGVAASLSANEVQLVVARVFQGAVGGFVVAPIFGFIQILFTGTRRVHAFGLMMAISGIAALIGPILGGQIIDFVGMENGWRFALLGGLPLGVLALVLAVPYLPRTTGQPQGRFDVAGMLLLAGIVSGFLVPVLQVTNGGLPGWSAYSFLGAGALTLLFIGWELRLERLQRFPLIPLSYFKRATFSMGLFIGVLAFASFTSSIYIALAVLWQAGRGESALQAALVTLPFSLGAIIGGFIAERVTAAFGRWAMSVSLAALVLGYFMTYAVLDAAPGVHMVILVAPLLIAGIGSGVFYAPNITSIVSSVRQRDAGAAGGMAVMVQRAGASLGSALVFIAIAQPGPGGPADFGAQAMTGNGIASVLVCTWLAAAALVFSLILALATRQAPAAGDALPAETA